MKRQNHICSVYWLFIIYLLAAGFCPSPVYAKKAGMVAVSRGDGCVDLFWPPASSMYSGGGWQLKDMRSGKIVARWGAEDLKKNIAEFSDERQQKLHAFFDDLHAAKNKEERSSMMSWLVMGGMTDFQSAIKLGMAIELIDVPAGKRRYRLSLLNGRKKTTGKSITSPAVDSSKASPLPPALTNVRGQSSFEGMQLFWDQPAYNEKSIPAPLVQITRVDKDGHSVDVTTDPVWISPDRDSEKPGYLDTTAPLEAEIIYTLRRVDIFGRQSEAASVTVLNEDLDALNPPHNIAAEAGENRVKLTWELRDNPYTIGYVVERSRRNTGVYEVLTAKGLSRTTKTYVNKNVKGGFVYYYRVRSIGPRGDVGIAPDAVSVMVKTDGRPDSPDKLTARVEPTRIILNWKAMPLPVAGYIVEKKKKEDNTWVRINSRLATRPELEDPINLGDYGQRTYRVTAVSFGNAMSDPSDDFTVELPGHPIIPVPFIQDIVTEKGSVKITYQAAQPVEQTEKILLVRGNDIRDMGLVIAKDLDGDSTKYEDTLVKPGEDYWYALIALDKDGHRSKMSNKFFVIVSSPDIPRPGRPDVEFEEKPFRHVTITFDKPEGFLRASVMRRIGNESWVTIVKDIVGTGSAVDADPPFSETISYRVAYLDESHHWGQPSKEAVLELKDD